MRKPAGYTEAKPGLRILTPTTTAGLVGGREERVPYAFVQDVAASWEHYQQVTATVIEPAPSGLILHIAGPTDEGFRAIEVWESEQAWRRFETERLAPAIAALGGPARPEPTFRDLRALHVVVGSGAARDNLGCNYTKEEQ